MGKSYKKVLVDRRTSPLIQRFTEKIQIAENGCWLWTGAIIKGYGVMTINGRNRQATHVAWNLFKKEDVPKGLTLDHFKCRNTLCVNPACLRVLSRSENSKDNKHIHQLQAVTHCPEGHPYDADNTFARKLPSGSLGRGCQTCASISNRANARYRRLIKKGIHTTYQEQLAISKTATVKTYKPRTTPPTTGKYYSPAVVV